MAWFENNEQANANNQCGNNDSNQKVFSNNVFYFFMTLNDFSKRIW